MKLGHIIRAHDTLAEFHGGGEHFLNKIDLTIQELEQTAEAIKQELPRLYDLKRHVEEAMSIDPMPASTTNLEGLIPDVTKALEQGLNENGK